MHKQEQQVVALAAAFQGLGQVVEIARRGRADPALVNICLQGLLQPYQPDVSAIYGGVRALRPGLLLLIEQLSQPTNVELTRYTVALLQLESALRKQPKRMQAISSDLEHVRRQATFFDGLSSGSTQAALSRIYSEHVSTLRPRVMVAGERSYLEQPHNADTIRALLLAGIRAVTLWRANGGRRLDLLFRRGRLVGIARELT